MFEYALQAQPYKTNNKSVFTQRMVTEKDIHNITDEALETIYEKGLNIRDENNSKRKENRRLYELFEKDFLEGFEDMGISVRGVRGGILKQYKTVLRECSPCFYLDRHPVEINEYSIGFQYKNEKISVSGNGNLERLKRFRKICEEKQKNEDKSDKLLIKSVEYAKDNNIKIEYLSNKEIVKKINDIAISEFLKEEYSDGSDVDFDDNLCECTKWTVGEHRCSCGNIRLHLEVEGDLLNGLYAYPMSH